MKLNLLPLFNSEVTDMSPLKTLTILLHTFRPNPIPYWLHLKLLESFPNILKSFTWSAFLMPIPVSIKLKCKFRLLASNSHSIEIEPSLVNLRAFESRLMMTYLSLLSSETTAKGTPGASFIVSYSPLAVAWRINMSSTSFIIFLMIICSSII